jgi:hypothetical protein
MRNAAFATHLLTASKVDEKTYLEEAGLELSNSSLELNLNGPTSSEGQLGHGRKRERENKLRKRKPGP